MATGKILGRVDSGSGAIQELGIVAGDQMDIDLDATSDTITFTATKPGQELIFSYIVAESREGGSVSLQAAALE